MSANQVREYKKKILSILLKKYERSLAFQTGLPGKQRPQLTMAKCELAKDYEDEMDYRKKEWIHAALEELTQEGIVEVTWPKFKENIQVHKVYLNYEGIEKAYQIMGEMPKEEKLFRLNQILAPLANHPWSWVRSWQQETCSKLSEKKSAGLDIDDLQGFEDLVKVLNALPTLDEGTPKRVLSQNLFQDSKYFERKIESRLLRLLRKVYPEELEEDEDYLDQVGIVSNPRLTLLSGPLVIQPARNHPCVDLSALPGGIGLTAETIKDMVIQGLNADTILLVENLTTYNEVLAAPDLLSSPLLVIYTGGFPHKSTQRLLQKIGEFLTERQRGACTLNQRDYEKTENYSFKSTFKGITGIYFWGDIDYGGICIFEFLKRNFFPGLKPYRMDVLTYREYQAAGLPFNEEQARKLQALLADPIYEDWYPLINELLLYRKRVEQESIRIGGV